MDNILRIDVCEHIKNLAGDDIVYLYPNPGNAGDSIIALGTFHAFSDYNIKYEFLDLTKPFDSNGKIVLYSGGGNLVKYYSDARKFLETHSSKAKRIIILPHTITDNQELLSGLGNNVDLISRELISYKYVSNIVTDANVYISDDMAFYMNSSRALSMKKISLMSCLLKTIIYRILNNDKAKSIPSPLRYLYILVLSFKKKRHLSLEKHKILNAFRTDVESTDVDIPNDNIDISRIYSFGTLDKYIIEVTSHMMMSYINKFDVVNTNRLHVAISSALLGKVVNFYPNSYYKNEAIYNYSIKNKFPMVNWMG